MRLVVTNPTYSEVKPYIKGGRQALRKVPAGVGSTGFVKLAARVPSGCRVRSILAHSKRLWLEEDLELTEETVHLKVPTSKISEKAIDRGFNQIGTLGLATTILKFKRSTGKHFLIKAPTLGAYHPGSGDVPLEPRIWSSGGDRLFTNFFVMESKELRYWIGN